MHQRRRKMSSRILSAASGSWLRFALVGLALAGGCSAIRVVIVPETEPVQLGEDVKAYVYVETTDGRVRSANRVRLHEGQWVLTDPLEKRK